MKYPQDFITAVKKEFPSEQLLHRALEAGGELVGRILDDSSTGGISPDRIIKMIDSGEVAKLRAYAAKLLLRKQLYAQWSTLWNGPDNHPMSG